LVGPSPYAFAPIGYVFASGAAARALFLGARRSASLVALALVFLLAVSLPEIRQGAAGSFALRTGAFGAILLYLTVGPGARVLGRAPEGEAKIATWGKIVFGVMIFFGILQLLPFIGR
jgi:hypothetical protein